MRKNLVYFSALALLLNTPLLFAEEPVSNNSNQAAPTYADQLNDLIKNNASVDQVNSFVNKIFSRKLSIDQVNQVTSVLASMPEKYYQSKDMLKTLNDISSLSMELIVYPIEPGPFPQTLKINPNAVASLLTNILNISQTVSTTANKYGYGKIANTAYINSKNSINIYKNFLESLPYYNSDFSGQSIDTDVIKPDDESQSSIDLPGSNQ